MSNLTHTAYAEAKKRYALAGIDTDAALKALGGIPVSMHCWQGDDVAGFEMPDVALSGGIQTTGNYPGKAKTADQQAAVEAARAAGPALFPNTPASSSPRSRQSW